MSRIAYHYPIAIERSRKKSFQVYILFSLTLLAAMPLSNGIAIFLFAAIGVLACLITTSGRATLPLFAYVTLAYVLAFPMVSAFPSFYPSTYSSVTVEELNFGMLWATRGFAAMALAYAFVSLKVNFRPSFIGNDGAEWARPLRHYNEYIVSVVGLLALIAWTTAKILFGVSLTFIESSHEMLAAQGSGTLVQILNLLVSLRYPFFVGVLVLAATCGVSKSILVLTTLLLMASTFEIVTVGSKATVISGFVAFAMIFAFVKVRMSSRQMVSGVLALAGIYLAFAVITEYRAIMVAEATSGRDVFSFPVQFEAFGDALSNVMLVGDSSEAVDRLSRIDSKDVLERFGSATMSFSNILSHTDREPPLEHAAETFLVPLYALAPRFIVRNKPEFLHSGRNASENYGWNYGGISVTLPGSLYFAWGYFGIVLGMALVGGMLAWLWKKSVVGAGAFMPFLILASSLAVTLLDVGQTFHASATNLVRLSILLFFAHCAYPYVGNHPARARKDGEGARPA